jgi:hypothetical protein
MKRTASSIAMTAALLMAAPAIASTTAHIKFEGVDGESATEVPLDGWSFGACQSGRCSTVSSATADQSSAKGGKGRASMQDFHRSAPPPAKGKTTLTASQNSQSLRGGVNVAAGDLDGDGRADLAYAGTLPEVSSLTLHFDKASPVLAKICMGKHIAKAELGRGTETMVIENAAVTCSSGAATRTTQGATFGEKVSTGLQSGGPVTMTFTSGKIHTRTGHVTLMK